jgi:hypothetical protein
VITPVPTTITTFTVLEVPVTITTVLTLTETKTETTTSHVPATHIVTQIVTDFQTVAITGAMLLLAGVIINPIITPASNNWCNAIASWCYNRVADKEEIA